MTAFPIYFVDSKNNISSFSSNWGLDLFILKINSKKKY